MSTTTFSSGFDATKHGERDIDIHRLQLVQLSVIEDNLPAVGNLVGKKNPKDNSNAPDANGYKNTTPTTETYTGPDIYGKSKGGPIQLPTEPDIEIHTSDTEEEQQKQLKKESRIITYTQDQFLEEFEDFGKVKINKTNKYFQGLEEEEIMGKLDEFIADQEVPTRNRLGKINASGRTILHAILRDAVQKRFEEQLGFLFKWLMKEYPELYQCKYTGDNNEPKTVLHLAAAKAENRYFVRFFVKNYPAEAAEILGYGQKKEDIPSLLLLQIMPFISDCDDEKFLKLFSGTDVDADVEEDKHTYCCCSCPRLVSTTQKTKTRTLSNPDFEAPKRVDTAGFALSSISAITDHEKNTVLHLAAQYVPEYDAKQTESQLRLVTKVFLWCPKALGEVNHRHHSVYQHRLHGLCAHMSDKSPKSPENNGEDSHISDRIADFLKDKILHLLDRDKTINLLRGRYGAIPGPERQTQLDLGEAENANVSEDALIALLKSLEFENILQYVHIPRRPFSVKADSATSGDASDGRAGASAGAGAGRQDFGRIFDLLHEKGVKKIIRLIVDDNEDCPHTDEIIEGLNRFKIEDWKWEKVDISSVVLRKAAEHAQHVRLLSSGNHSVLRDWSSCDGLKELKHLEAVHVVISRRVESEAKTQSYKTDFETRMAASCPKVKTYVKVETATTGTSNPGPTGGHPMKPNNWFEDLNKFLSFFTNIPPAVHARAPDVRVAIIDDGIDSMQPGSQLWQFIAQGESFYTERQSLFTRTNSYFFSTTGHGTLMANLVHNVCPKAQLYIARLQQGHGGLQFTAESAVKAILWAIQKKVHIISMSWTIPDNPEGTTELDPTLQKLDDAIKEAQNAGILMFGAASDQGLNSSIRPPYPAKCKDGGVICIGAAKDSGHPDERAVRDAEFFFPGSTQGTKENPEQIQQLLSSYGSSVATALAAGFAAMIMYCLEISKHGRSEHGPQYRKKLQDSKIIKEIFKRKGGNGKFIAVSGFFPPNKFSSDEGGVWDLSGKHELDQAIHEIIKPYIIM
ncbi:hypothetical protein K440DRAFT_623902 [Wilcoxina mikolae CBS 423.85]|nr:hypothetical protein K440DRAFT_623902 [Wilcoxina mikolae CBS 423.85]